MNKLSIIIVSYNAATYLRSCLESIFEPNHGFSFETIVVDNKSTDNSVATVRKEFPQVRLVENSHNAGFAKANNIGLAKATGKYVLFLNSDTKILGDGLSRLIHFLDKNQEVGVVAPKLVYPDFTDQGVARQFPTPINAFFGRKTLLTRLFPTNRFSKRYLKCLQHTSNASFEVDWVSGASLMTRKEILDTEGSFDEKFFMYWEDLDLCYRIKKAGWNVYCVPTAIVVHFEGKSTSPKVSNRSIIEFNKGVYRYYRKHHIHSFFEMKNIIAVLGLTLRALSLLAFNQIKKGKWIFITP